MIRFEGYVMFILCVECVLVVSDLKEYRGKALTHGVPLLKAKATFGLECGFYSIFSIQLT